MDSAYISAPSALAGSAGGGLTSGITTWMSPRAQVRAGRLALDVSRRQNLFNAFVVAASKRMAMPWCSEPQFQELVGVYAMISRMRVVCSPKN